jgi:hypothetical protein
MGLTNDSQWLVPGRRGGRDCVTFSARPGSDFHDHAVFSAAHDGFSTRTGLAGLDVVPL